MKKIIELGGKKFARSIPYRRIKRHIKDYAKSLNIEFRGSKDPVVLLCVLNGSIMFAAELMKYLDFPVELVTIKLSSYQGTESTGKIKLESKLSIDIKNRPVVVVEDIVETGQTLEALHTILKIKKASKVKYCALFYKDIPNQKGPVISYGWNSIKLENNDFVVGFGLDYNGLGRNLRDLYVIK